MNQVYIYLNKVKHLEMSLAEYLALKLHLECNKGLGLPVLIRGMVIFKQTLLASSIPFYHKYIFYYWNLPTLDVINILTFPNYISLQDFFFFFFPFIYFIYSFQFMVIIAKACHSVACIPLRFFIVA